MTDDNADIDALLEAPLDEKKNEAGDTKENTKSVRESRRSRSRSTSRDRKRKRSSSRERRRSRSRSKDRRRRKSRSRSRDRRRSRSRDRKRSRSRSRDRRRRSRSRDRRRRSRSPYQRPRVMDHRRSPSRRSPPRSRLPGPERRDVMPFTAKNQPPEGAKLELSAEERDHRTLLIMQIGRMTRPRDLEEFFSAVGNVRDVRIITDSRTGRSKGIGYVEFWEEESVSLGLALNGQKLQGAPLLIQRTCSERNRAAAGNGGAGLGFAPTSTKGPALLLIENVHPMITESMLRDVFESFGRIDRITMGSSNSNVQPETATVSFRNAEDAAKARDNLNNLDLAGRNIRIVLRESDDVSSRQKSLDSAGDGLISGNGNRAQLMNKLAQSVPEAQEELDPSIPSIATQCFMLSNMFDPNQEFGNKWDEDVREDVIEECAKHGGALHVYVDKGSQGNVYVKCPSVLVSHKSVTALHGRWFSGKVITANYVPVESYHSLFPDAVPVRPALKPIKRAPEPAAAAPTAQWAPPPPPPVGHGFGYY